MTGQAVLQRPLEKLRQTKLQFLHLLCASKPSPSRTLWHKPILAAACEAEAGAQGLLTLTKYIRGRPGRLSDTPVSK